jgi:lysyl-tRNA synthetase class 2
MATKEELKKVRTAKLKSVRDSGLLAYPLKTKRTHTIKQALRDFTKLSKSHKEIVLVGRIRLLRPHGGSSFIQFEDGTGIMQGFFRKDKIGQKGYKFFLENFDIGDFIELKGELITTKRGEKTVDISDFKMLTKSLRPLPEKWHGLKEIEDRLRQRYLDLLFNADVRSKFESRSKIVRTLREFLDKEKFLEVETPILQSVYSGARAKPFKTHLNAMDLDLYLRIAPELYLKRLLIGGFEKVYEIGKCFRNEGIDRHHNPDFTMLEFYWAYADYKDLMKLTEKMYIYLLKEICKKTQITYQGQKINFKTPWQRVEFYQLFSRELKINLQEINRDALAKEGKKLGIEIKKGSPKAEIADEIFKKTIRPKIQKPTFVIHYPVGFQPLAKALEKDPTKLANFQLIVAGMELCNAFSELNDPIEQKNRFDEQEKLFKKGFEEALRKDKDFLEALEYGMPPAAGFGMGIDRLSALLTDSHSLREIILFPTMRPRQ